MGFFRHTFTDPLDSPARTLAHRALILRKPFLKRLYQEWYRQFLSMAPTLPPGPLVELGSGGGFLKELIPSVISSDILNLPTVDLRCSGVDLPFPANSISGLLMIDTFHHLPDAEKFLSEAGRVLKSGGKVAMIEPWNTVFSRWIYRHFHHETFDIEAGWTLNGTGPLSTSNMALPWITFVRDRRVFVEKFPGLRLECITPHTPLRYLVSGGLTYRSFLPGIFFNAATHFERAALGPFLASCALFASIEIEKII